MGDYSGQVGKARSYAEDVAAMEPGPALGRRGPQANGQGVITEQIVRLDMVAKQLGNALERLATKNRQIFGSAPEPGRSNGRDKVPEHLNAAETTIGALMIMAGTLENLANELTGQVAEVERL